jgi:hypothetical protein
MKKFKNLFSKFVYFIYFWIQPILDPIKLLNSIPRYFGFIADWIRYSRKEGAEDIKLLDVRPCLHEKTKTSEFDKHYFYQDIWAFQRIYKSKVGHHIDVGSRIDFIGFLSVITKVNFIDIRPIETNIENLEPTKGDILSLPFKNDSILSLSCLHVVEHIGLGRYGDPINPFGTKKACKELSRILVKGGNLYFSLPIGKPKLCFNAHRIHSSSQILQYFESLELVEFSGVGDDGIFKENISINTFNNANYACGLFHFRKK